MRNVSGSIGLARACASLPIGWARGMPISISVSRLVARRRVPDQSDVAWMHASAGFTGLDGMIFVSLRQAARSMGCGICILSGKLRADSDNQLLLKVEGGGGGIGGGDVEVFKHQFKLETSFCVFFADSEAILDELEDFVVCPVVAFDHAAFWLGWVLAPMMVGSIQMSLRRALRGPWAWCRQWPRRQCTWGEA